MVVGMVVGTGQMPAVAGDRSNVSRQVSLRARSGRRPIGGDRDDWGQVKSHAIVGDQVKCLAT
jgi:hypothetical protein